MKEAKISVIVPVYNVEDYLDRCISSIVNQTYTNLEIILIDDGSKDSSGEICDEWGKKDNRIIVIHKMNGGISSARNAGLDISTGEYIGFVDSDDFINPYMYEELYTQMSSLGAEMIFCKFQNFENEDELYVKKIDCEVHFYSVKEAYYRLYARDCDIMNLAWNKLYKRTLFKEIRYPEGLTCEDAFVIHRLLEHCNKIIKDENILYYRQIRKDSIMGQINKYKREYEKKELDSLCFRRDRINRYKDIEDKNLLAMMYADYYQNLIVLYTKMRMFTNDKKEYNELLLEFKESFKITRKCIKFDIKKEIKYNIFYCFQDIIYLFMIINLRLK